MMEVKAGPYFHAKGTLTARDKDEIFEATGIRASIRARWQWHNKRGLTLAGPVLGMERAYEMAEEKILASSDGGDGDQQGLAPAYVANPKRIARAQTMQR